VVHNKPVEKGGSSPANNFEWEIQYSELTFGPRIGRGGYGEVYRGMWSGTEVAIKMLFTDNMSAKLITDLRNEVELLCKLRHPNIVLFMGACTEPETPCIVTEYLGRGSLANILLDESVEMDWGLRLQIGIDCARGMAYLHSRHPVIIHRDLKTDNLLVDDNWQVKVADFGLATVKSRTFAKTMCGTTGWVAPEVLAEEGYTEKADVYSFAIILWEMLTRQIPYAGKNTMQVVRSVDRGERLTIPDYCPPDYAQLINDCWNTDPAKRLSFAEVLARMEKMRTSYLQEKKDKEALQHVQAAEPAAGAKPMSADGANAAEHNVNVNDNNGNNAAPESPPPSVVPVITTTTTTATTRTTSTTPMEVDGARNSSSSSSSSSSRRHTKNDHPNSNNNKDNNINNSSNNVENGLT
jgi:serine/threonine protein kinase